MLAFVLVVTAAAAVGSLALDVMVFRWHREDRARMAADESRLDEDEARLRDAEAQIARNTSLGNPDRQTP
jgi:hypothetical protein